MNARPEIVANEADIEPSIIAMLDRRLANINRPAYEIVSAVELSERLQSFFASEAPGGRVEQLARMGGGGSKEQFRFTLTGAGSHSGDYVLRMDPYAGVVETDRTREFEVIRAMQGVIPVPEVGWLDADGARLGRPSIIMAFKNGVIKPTDTQVRNITGIGLEFSDQWANVLSSQFLHILKSIHGFDWRNATMPSFYAPCDDPLQSARWQVNWWSRIWTDDKVVSVPLVALTKCWLLDNLPECAEPLLLHGDYRSGNFLFDEESGKITAMLDWELAHIGDYHEDLAWILQSGTADTGLISRNDLLTRYEALTGRQVNLKTLHFYEVFSAFKILVMTQSSALRNARSAHSHQDVLLTWMSTCGYKFQSEICKLLDTGDFK